MKDLEDYFALQKKIYKYFGYIENWRVIPLDDSTDYYWRLDGEGSGGEVVFAEGDTAEAALAKMDSDNGDYYSNSIYTQRFLKKWVYRGEEYTMICVDTHTDGNVFLSVFDNNKEIK